MNLIAILKKHDDTIKRKYGVKKIGVFGSFARGEEKENSDIDVLVDFKEGAKTFDNFMELKFFLEDLFGRKIDLVTVKALRPQLKEDILKDEMRIDAVVRNFEIIGEAAASKIPDNVKNKYPLIEWRKVSDFRNVLAHEYFGLDYEIMWEIIKDKLPNLQKGIQAILEKEK